MPKWPASAELSPISPSGRPSQRTPWMAAPETVWERTEEEVPARPWYPMKMTRSAPSSCETMPRGRGLPRSSRALWSSSSGSRLVKGPCESATTTSAWGSPSSAPRTAALASLVMSRRPRSYSALPGRTSSGTATPAIPSMSTEIRIRTEPE